MKLHEAIYTILKNNAELSAIVGTKIEYARAPFDTAFPMVYFFDVAYGSGTDMDYNRATIQISAWSENKYEATKMYAIFISALGRLKKHTVAITGGNFVIEHSEVIEAGTLPTDDPLLFGSFVRVVFKYRGENIGGTR